MGSNHEKYGVRKSRDTLPLKTISSTKKGFLTLFTLAISILFQSHIVFKTFEAISFNGITYSDTINNIFITFFSFLVLVVRFGGYCYNAFQQKSFKTIQRD